jgi:hypothetical protein
MDFMSAFAGLSAAGKSAKDLLEIREIALSAEAKLKIADIQLALADARSNLAESKEKISELESSITDIQKNSDQINSFERKGVLFFDCKTILYKCPTCIESKKQIITLTKINNIGQKFICNSCKSEFINPDYNHKTYKITDLNTA